MARPRGGVTGGGAPDFETGWSGALRYRLWPDGRFDIQAGYEGSDGGLQFSSSASNTIVVIPELAGRNPEAAQKTRYCLGWGNATSDTPYPLELASDGSIRLSRYSSSGDFSFGLSTVVPDLAEE